jgi:hypothetical protein
METANPQKKLNRSTDSSKGVSGTSRFRMPTPGPESQLVDWCIHAFPFEKNEYETVMFREPRVRSGFPDLVIVSWDANAANWWPVSRLTLTEHDIRLMHFLSCEGIATNSDLDILQLPSLKQSIDRLESSNMICQTKNRRWKLAAKLDELFAVRQLIAIEAKMQAGRKVLDQAFINTWFAPVSYVLLPKQPGNSIFQQAKKLGIGILTQQDGVLLSPPSHKIHSKQKPRSYATWMFNEWTWKNQQITT